MLAADHDAQAVGKTLLVLLSAFPAAGMSGDMATAKVAGYRLALEDLPTWAIDAAAKMWLRGEVAEAGQFAPSPPAFRKAAAALVEKVKTEADGWARFLGASVPPEPNPPVSRERAAEILGRVGIKLDREEGAN